MCSGLVKRRETLIVLSVQFPRASSAVMVKLNAELKVIVEFLSKVRTTFPFPAIKRSINGAKKT